MAKSYTAEDIRKLEPMEQIQISPGMWIGPTDDPHHLVEEAFDNALDEAQGGHVSIIAIKIDTKNHVCSIMDNGRGIPISKDVPIIISTQLFSGAKFQDNKSAYEIASGLHGVGLVCANALSDFYTVEIYRNNRHAIFNFEHGKLKKKSIKEHNGATPFSTKIEFKPSKKIFDNLVPDLNRIKKRLQIASAEMPKVTFALIVDDTKEIFKLTIKDYFEQRCLQGNNILSPPVMFKANIKPESYNVMMTYAKSGTITPKVLSSVNLLPVDNGGTHVNYLYEIVKDYFVAKGKKLGYKFEPQDCLIGLKAYLMLSLKEPKFAGQTKDRLTNNKATLEKFAAQIKAQLEVHFNENKNPDKNGEGDLDRILSHFQIYRAKLDSKKFKSVNAGKRVSTKFTKLRDCSSKFGELFVAEGESAAGGLVDCRDPRKHAILPLKGKIPSAATAKDILKNKEIGELIGSFGTGVGPDFDIADLKYSKIICATDADDDGLHIFALLTLALAILVPEIIKNGHYFYAETPLYAINEKNNFVPLWTTTEVTKAREENKPLLRVKGLGEMNPDQLKVVLINENTRRLIPVTYSSDINKMVKLFSDSGEKRKLLEGTWMI
jgi:DNA gyrase/topoisomerase IV subunit B